MYGPIANLHGYNPNATYLPPGIAAPSSYPERKAPTQQFYNAPALPSVVDSSINTLAQGGLSSSDPNDSAFGPTGISGGIGGADGLDYAFLNFINRYSQPQQPQAQAKPEQMVPPNYSGPSNDQYSGEYLVPPTFGGPQQWSFENYNRAPQTNVSAQEEGQGWITGQPTYAQPSWPQDFYQSQTPLQPFNIQPSGLTQSQLDQLGRLPSLPGSEIGDRTGNSISNILGTLAPFPFSLIPGALYGAYTGANGERLPSDPDAGLFQRMVDPREPGPIASAVNWGVRQLVGDKTQAELSAEKAYGSGGVYDKGGAGWVEGTPTGGSAAMAAPTDFGSGAYNGGYDRWWQDPNAGYTVYDQSGNITGYNSPYSLTGDMLDLPMWGPGTRYVQGNKFDTN